MSQTNQMLGSEDGEDFSKLLRYLSLCKRCRRQHALLQCGCGPASENPVGQVFWEQKEFGKHCIRITQSYSLTPGSLTPGGTKGRMLTSDSASVPSIVQGSQVALPGAELSRWAPREGPVPPLSRPLLPPMPSPCLPRPLYLGSLSVCFPNSRCPSWMPPEVWVQLETLDCR